jgi:exonuclease III
VTSLIVSTVNVNGIRAAVKRRSEQNLGLLPWLASTTADVVCLQETRADDDQLSSALADTERQLSWLRCRWRRVPSPRGWNVPRPRSCGGPTTRR